MSSALGGAVVTFTALAAIGISGSVVLEAFQMKKTKTFRYLLTDTFILFAFGGLLIALGYFFCFFDLHTAFEPINSSSNGGSGGTNSIGIISHLRKGVGLVWGITLCGASVYLLQLYRKHRGGQSTLQGGMSGTTMTSAPKATLRESISKNLFKFNFKKSGSTEVKGKSKFKWKK